MKPSKGILISFKIVFFFAGKDTSISNIVFRSFFLLIFPLTRKLIFGKISKKFKKRENEKNNFIDGEFEDIDDDNDRKI